ncbi:DUF1015 family protein [Blastopirellula marina]|uniref:DUF1015 domain-containing protein n=1 Tax=Blastopirellula marina TaxID=124 RepID=A0A2S8GJ13_9BACT|nr:DUF1015 family protein [Blastopirellula marina]PQO44418.1 hypothetical protein C5Y93_18545 [Blastopirellula marina]
MPEIRAIHGLRYDLGHVGSLAEVISPPADEITPEMVGKLYQRNPSNVVRVLTNQADLGDDERINRYSRAARFAADWQRWGVLRRDPDPAIYVYHQEFERNGQTFTRRGFLAGSLLSNDPDQQSSVQGAVDFWKTIPQSPDHHDPILMLRATGMNVEPKVEIYIDPTENTQQILENAIATMTPLIAQDDAGVTHRLWPVTDHHVIGAVREAMAHRLSFQTSHRDADFYRHFLQKQLGGELPSNHPAHAVLTAFFPLTEPNYPGVPQCGLFQEAPAMSSTQLMEHLAPFVECFPYGQSENATEEILQQLSDINVPGFMALYCFQDQQWVIASPTDLGLAQMKELLPDVPAAYRDLDRTILEHLILLKLNVRFKPDVSYLENLDRLRSSLRTDSPTRYTIATLVRSPSPEELESLWLEDDDLYFEPPRGFDPKPACGLVFNPLT